MRIYMSKPFARFARKEGLSDKALWDTVREAEAGKIDADLGGGVIKQRVARLNEGKSSGYRTIILYRLGERAFFVHGYAKKDRDNITSDEEKAFKKAAQIVLNLPEDVLRQRVAAGDFTEVIYDDEND